jgi:hypothetical protein
VRLCPCGREAIGFAYDPRIAGVSDAPPIAACSFAHVEIIKARKGKVVPLTDTENLAVMNAAPIAGEYLDKLGKTDLAEMSYEEWMDFIAATCDAFLTERGKLFEAQSGGVPV